MAKLKLSAPWYIKVRELEAMFKYDNEVHVVYDDEISTVTLYVDNYDKACALEALLPEEYMCGRTLTVEVVPPNDATSENWAFSNETKEFLYALAFENNPAFAFSRAVQLGTNTITYVVFAKMVVQFFTDDLGDAYGNCSTLYQEIAKDIFGESEGVSFCTDIKDVVWEDDEETINIDLNSCWP